MFFWFYNVCFPFVFLFLLPGYLWRMLRRGDFRARFGQRFGWYSREVRARLAKGPPRIWVQAVSVGEMLTALKFIAALREQIPGLPLILSTTTTTGYRLAEARAGEDVVVAYPLAEETAAPAWLITDKVLLLLAILPRPQPSISSATL